MCRHLRTNPTQAWNIICVRLRSTGSGVGLFKFIFWVHYWTVCIALTFVILGFLLCDMRRINEILHAKHLIITESALKSLANIIIRVQ